MLIFFNLVKNFFTNNHIFKSFSASKGSHLVHFIWN